MSLTQINKAGLDEIALDHVFTIGASGSSAYTFQGEGLNGTVNNPTLYLTRGKTYRFENGSGGHPIRIQSTSGASGTAYNTGVTNNAGSGTVIVEVQHDAPDVLYYQCTSHAAMNGILYITGALADSGVTTAKIADDAVTAAKIADGTIQQFNLASNAVTTAKINANAVTTAKMADGSINTTQIADQAVTLAKLEHGTSSNNGKFLRANNGADPTFETVNTDLSADSSPQLGAALDTNGYNINFGDSTSNGNNVNRLRFGTATNGDLEIYHDGSNSYITDRGTGELRLMAAETLRIRDTDSGEEMITCNKNGSVDLYHNNVKKFETGTNYSVVTSISNGNPAGLKITNSDPNSNYSHAELRLISKNGASYGVIYNDHANSCVRIGHNTTGNTLEVFNDGGIRSQYIKFGSDTASTNNLDDYEEGTWTPTFGGQLTSQSYSQQLGVYTKIGNIVVASAQLKLAGDPGSYASNVSIGGLPFNGKNGGTGDAAVLAYQTNFNSATDGRGNFTGMVNPNQASIRFYTPDGTYYLWSEVNDRDEQIRVTATYRTD